MMQRSSKILIAAAIVVGILALGLIYFFTADFDSPAVGQAVLGQLSTATGLEITADSFQLNLLRGLRVDGVKAKGPAAGGELDASMERLVLRHQLGPLFGGTLQVDELLFVAPRIELKPSDQVAPDDEEPALPVDDTPVEAVEDDGSEADGLGLDLQVASIRVEDGFLALRSPDGDTVVEDLDLELADLVFPGSAAEPAGSAAAMTGSGRIRAARVTSGETVAENADGRIEIGEGHVRVVDFVLEADQGPLTAQLDLDLVDDPLAWTLELRGSDLRTHDFLGLADATALGTSDLTMTLQGVGGETATVEGQGGLSMADGTLPAIALFTAIDGLLGRPILVGQRYEPLQIDFQVRDERLQLAPFEINCGAHALRFDGWADLEGLLDFQLATLTPREGIAVKEIPDEVLELLTDDTGRANLPIRLSGTLENPSVSFDREALAALGKRYVRRRAEQEVTKALGSLFSRKRKDDG